MESRCEAWHDHSDTVHASGGHPSSDTRACSSPCDVPSGDGVALARRDDDDVVRRRLVVASLRPRRLPWPRRKWSPGNRMGRLLRCVNEKIRLKWWHMCPGSASHIHRSPDWLSSPPSCHLDRRRWRWRDQGPLLHFLDDANDDDADG